MGNLWVPLSNDLHARFKSKHPKGMAEAVIDFIKHDLGEDDDGVSKELKRLRTDLESTQKRILELEGYQQTRLEEEKAKLIDVWSDFRKVFSQKQGSWLGDHNIVNLLFRTYGISMTYNQLYNVYDEMEELNETG